MYILPRGDLVTAASLAGRGWRVRSMVGRSPWTWGPLWGRRPRRPARALLDADSVVAAGGPGGAAGVGGDGAPRSLVPPPSVVPAAGGGGPERTRGSAPPGCTMPPCSLARRRFFVDSIVGGAAELRGDEARH